MTEIKKEILQVKEIDYSSVRITDPVLENAFYLELEYLKSLDPDKLLAGFRETAGLTAKAQRYPGWETTEIQGHTLGHYLTALAQAYGETIDESLLAVINYILSELKSCQSEDGYLFASPKELFDKVENKQPVWVPWYTMHKIMEGLIAAYRFTNNQDAFDIMTALGMWIYNRCINWDKITQEVVLSVEYGGMNDCLYDLYLLTGKICYADAAHQFDEILLFTDLYEKKDVLNGLHANTTIPKIIGALKRFIAFGMEESFYFKAAKNFWDIVVKHHTYITGGNSEWEHFGEPDILDEERSACNCETCNTYNMLKLTKLLFQITKEKKYADYYERTFINAILSSQNPKTGMTTYFQPMATGYFKVYSTPFDRFWCCTGTGMENFTKLTEGIYFTTNNRIYINRYVDSTVAWEAAGITLKVSANLLESDKITIKIKKINHEFAANFEIALRIPEWSVSSEIKIVKNNIAVRVREEDGYFILTDVIPDDGCIEAYLPMTLKIHTLPDNTDTIALTYGPFVLSAELGEQMMDTTVTGVDVLVPKKEIIIKDYLILDNIEIQYWKDYISDYLIKDSDEIKFVLKNTEADRQLTFIPHFMQFKKRYGIYFRLYQKGTADLKHYNDLIRRKQQLAKLQLDTVPISNSQYELAHKIKGEKTDTTRVNGHPCRYAKEGGWFTYDLNIDRTAGYLCVTYCRIDAGMMMDVYLNDILLVSEKLGIGSSEFYTVEYVIPQEIIMGNNTVNVKFQNRSISKECRIFDELYIKKETEKN